MTRRTVAKGAAWTIPAVAMATPVSAASVSGQVFQITGTTVACKYSDLKHYHLEVEIKNTGNVASTITNVDVTGENSSGQTIVWPDIANKCMCPGATWVLVVNSVTAAGEGNIASFGARISWTGQTPITLATASDTTPDCNSQKPPYEDENTVNSYEWIYKSGPQTCAGCP